MRTLAQDQNYQNRIRLRWMSELTDEELSTEMSWKSYFLSRLYSKHPSIIILYYSRTCGFVKKHRRCKGIYQVVVQANQYIFMLSASQLYRLPETGARASKGFAVNLISWSEVATSQTKDCVE